MRTPRLRFGGLASFVGLVLCISVLLEKVLLIRQHLPMQRVLNLVKRRHN